MDGKSYIIKTMESFPKEYNAVALFWKDPFGSLNKRTGFFESYLEAFNYSEYLNSIYSNLDMPYLIYLNDSIVSSRDVELVKEAEVANV